MFLKRLFILILAAVLVIVPLASCNNGSSGDDTSTDEGSTTSTKGESTTAVKELREYTDEIKVLDNYWPKYDTSEYAEMRTKIKNWFVSNYYEGEKAPFSFIYGGSSSVALLKKWTRDVKTSEESDGTHWTISYTNPDDGFCVWADFVLYNDYPTLEWTAYAKNGGKSNSKKISYFYGMNVSFELDSDDLVLHTTVGSQEIRGDDLYDFTLVTEKLSKHEIIFHPEIEDGRSSEHAWPFFDICGKNNGLMFGIGWTGVWKAIFSSDGKNANIIAGMNELNTFLYADEEIRTPLYSLTYFDGDAEYGHNLFRKTVLSHYTPDDGTEDVCKLPVAVTTESYGENFIIPDIEKWNGKLSIDTIWTDAAWFGNTNTNSWGVETGNWWVNKVRYPSGSLRKVSDYVHSIGKKYVVWFEIERVANGTDLYNNHSDLLLGMNIAGSKILNLASDAGYDWAYNYLYTTLTENNIDVYRQDFNSPGIARAWKANDQSGRTGMTEIKYITNFYKLYDALRTNIPGLYIDDCASGGKRIDLEMLKRCVVLHRSDYTTIEYGDKPGQWNMEGVQFQIQNISYWLPLHGGGAGYPVSLFTSTYLCRSMMSPSSGLGISVSYAADNRVAQKVTKELSDYRGYCIGDYYSLIAPCYDKTSKQAWMFVRDDIDEAFIQVYSRPSDTSGFDTTLKLKGLKPDMTYFVTNDDAIGGMNITATGKELMENGLEISIRPSSAKFFIIKSAEK